MKQEAAWSFTAAVLLHAAVLFGFTLKTPPRPMELADESAPVDVALVAPEAEPAPTPEAESIPSPEPAAPISVPAPERPKTAVHHHSHAALPHPATKIASPAGAAGRDGAPSHGAGGGANSRPSYLSNPRPEYPEEAKHQGQQGVVIVNVEVDADGRAADVSLSRSSGFPLLDQAALEAVRRWTFEPAREGGFPVASRVDVPVRFSLAR